MLTASFDDHRKIKVTFPVAKTVVVWTLEQNRFKKHIRPFRSPKVAVEDEN